MTRLLNGVGLGTFPFAGPFSELGDDATSILGAYLDAGGTYIDTAPTYDYGEVESVLGRELAKRPRESFFVNTSCGYILDGEGKAYVVSGRPEDVIADCDASLSRLGLEYIDSYISHIPDPNVPFAETVGAMEELRQAGKVRMLGVSNVTLEQLEEYNASGAISLVQNRFSYLNRSIAADFADYCVSHDVGIVAYQVIERGMLTAKGRGVFVLRDGDLRQVKSEFGDEIREAISAWVSTSVTPIAERHGVPLAALAVWWALQQPFVALAQFGATSVAQIQETMRVCDASLPAETLRELDDAYAVLSSQLASDEKGSVRDFLGLSTYNFYGGSATGKGVAPQS
ncbi:MAG: aldo/keto reductase [Solirubrobacterales bacterium]